MYLFDKKSAEHLYIKLFLMYRGTFLKSIRLKFDLSPRSIKKQYNEKRAFHRTL